MSAEQLIPLTQDEQQILRTRRSRAMLQAPLFVVGWLLFCWRCWLRFTRSIV